MASEGSRAFYSSAANPAVIVLILPPPAAHNEAYFVGVVPAASGCRVFMLEHAVMPADGRPFTVLAELIADGRLSWGAGSAADAEAFAAWVRRLVTDPSARPASFVPMQLA